MITKLGGSTAFDNGATEEKHVKCLSAVLFWFLNGKAAAQWVHRLSMIPSATVHPAINCGSRSIWKESEI